MRPETLLALSTTSSATPDGANAPPLRTQLERAEWFRQGDGLQDGRVRWSPPSRGDRSAKEPAWTLRECAIACRHLEPRIYDAIRFEFALDDSVIFPLHRHLVKWTHRERHARRWPLKVRTTGGRTDYVERLAMLHLLEQRQPWRFAKRPNTPNLRQVLMGVDAGTWNRQLEDVYETLRTRYLIWVDIGLASMRRAMRDEDNDSSA